ncbi:MAG: M23 family metallopeptidase [Clostridiales bacterium]|nr:M23 family metallopeptidase [Clostridiales bacterium]MCF8022501.1 M23 family metallopeptidase [Clostridiales bacterium]
MISPCKKTIFSYSRIYLTISFILITISIFLAASNFILWKVVVEGKNAAVSQDRQSIKEAVRKLHKQKESKYGFEVDTKQDLRIMPLLTLKPRDFTCAKTRDEIINQLNDKVDFTTSGVAIVINGKERVYVSNIETARKSLKKIEDKYCSRQDAAVSFKEEIKLTSMDDILANKIDDLNSAVDKLGGNAQKTEYYWIQEGDTLWDIASEKGIKREKILQLNDEIKNKKLHVGQKIKLVQKKHLLNVITRYKDVQCEDIPYSVMQKKDNELDITENKLIQKGIPGKKRTIYQVVEENGAIVKQKTVNQEIIKEPRPQIEVTGNDALLAYRSGREIHWPVQGNITSGFGWRHGEMHSGVDIAASYGAPVVAMMSGNVQVAKTKKQYGKLIKIVHKNGLATKYAHLSSILVPVGKVVSSGEKIGSIGVTGNATGPHLHFEVLINGKTVDPLEYFKSCGINHNN